jgi:hypothetical protein
MSIHPIGHIRIWTPEHHFRAVWTRTKTGTYEKVEWGLLLAIRYRLTTVSDVARVNVLLIYLLASSK